MPPTFRSSRSGRQFESANRTRTGQVDHDVFEGLPVRRWTRQRQTITQQRRPEQKSIMQGPDGRHIVPELPMPRDSQLLNPTSRALLRAARAGCIYIRHAPKEPGEEAKDAPTDAEESQAMRLADRSFTARKWTAVPGHVEPPEVEVLASRRPGLPSLYGAGVLGAVGSRDTCGPAPMRRTRFKRVDPATGNISVYEAWVPDGLRIEGETAEDTQTIAAANGGVTVTPEAPAPGTVVEGVGAANSEGVVVAEAESASVLSPAKRRPPPPKRKGKGIGRGRRKKVMFAPGEGADASMVHGAEAGAAGGTPEAGVGKERAAAVPGEEDEEEGEEGEESDDGDESMVDAKTPETPVQQASEPTPDIKPEPLAEPGPGSSAPTEAPAAEAPSQPQPEVSHTLPDMPSEVKQSDEQPAAEDVDMKDPNQATEAPPPATTSVQNTEQGAPNEPPESVTEDDQAQTTGQTAVSTGGAGENNDTDISSHEAAPEHVASGDQPGKQIEEMPTTDEAEIEVKKESEDQAGERVEEPTEQAGEQPAEHPNEQKPAQSEEPAQDNQQEQEQPPANQPRDQTTENQLEAQPAGEEQVPEQEEEDQTSLPAVQPPEPAPTSSTEDQPNPDEPSAEHEGGLKDVKEEGEGESAPTGQS